jgi:small-conductance mechanosensitive channel
MERSALQRPASAAKSGGGTADAAPQRHRVSPWALWFGLFGAPLVWSVQLLVGYGVDAHSCFPHTVRRLAPAFGWTWGLQFVVGIAALAGSLLALLVAYRSWRATASEDRGGHGHLLDVGEGRTRFMAFSGILVSALFTLAVLLNWVPLFIVPTCG